MMKIYDDKINETERTVGSRESDDFIDLSSVWRVIKNAKWILLLTLTLSTSVGVYLAYKSTPIYEATASILANPQQPNATREDQYVASALVYLFFETQYEIIRSRNLAETVVDNLNLVEKYKDRNKGTRSEQSFFAATIQRIQYTIGNEEDSKTKDQDVVELTDNEIKLMLAKRIQAGILVTGGRQSQVINLSYRDADPKYAAAIINALSEAYIEFGLESRLREVNTTEAWLNEQFNMLGDKLRESERALRNFRVKKGFVDTERERQIGNTQLQTLNSELISAQTNLSAIEEQFFAIKDVPRDSEQLYSIGPVLQNNTANTMVKDVARLSQRVNELEERYGEKHPRMVAARSELTSAEGTLSREINKIIDNIKRDYKLAKSQVENIKALIEDTKQGIQSIQTESFELVSLEREVENNRRIYENFQVSLTEASGISQYTASNTNIIDFATVPSYPVLPNKKLIVFVSSFLGLIIGILIAFIKEAVNNTFRTPSELEESIKQTVLGITISLKIKELKGIPELEYTYDNRSIFAESINTIRTGLQFSNIDNPPKTMLVTSAIGSEGKSTLSMNLAASFSQIGKTLLLEVDLRKPSVARNLSVENKKGLTSVISGEFVIEECIIKPSDDTNLDVMVCGVIPHKPIETLMSNKFAEVLNKLKANYDFIILDGPPVMPVSDACVVGSMVDGVVVAVRSESTKVKDLKRTLVRLKEHNANIVGTVLTVAEPTRLSYYGDNEYSMGYYGAESNGN